MKLVKVIRHSDISGGSNLKKGHKERLATRAVIFDKNENIALLYSPKTHYYQLPGGGVHDGEGILEAMHREALEETGCKIKITREIGRTKLFMDERMFLSHSHCYIARVIKKTQEPELDPDEVRRGLQLIWLPIDEAIRRMEDEPIDDYLGKFVRKITIWTLKHVRKINENKNTKS